jgi:CheY-like chemotaxis protein
LRQDPDVIFVGEIRDSETAQIAAQAAMTGHLVLATMHTNDAMSSVARMADLGLDRQTIASTLRGTLAQRLLRRVCPDCAQPLIGALTEEEETLGARYGVLPLSRAVGCRRCGNTGYRGRLPLIEVAVITPSLSDMIAGGATTQALQRAAVAAGMAPMRDVAIARVRRGETTLQEIERVIGDGREEQPLQGGPASILLVNADPTWRRMARALLEGGGFSVTEASDAGQAMQLMGNGGGQFALMVTDLMSPAISPMRQYEALPMHTSTPKSLPRLPARTRVSAPILSPRSSAPISAPPASVTEHRSQDVDWARFTATVQSAIRRTEH